MNELPYFDGKELKKALETPPERIPNATITVMYDSDCFDEDQILAYASKEILKKAIKERISFFGEENFERKEK